MKVTRNAAIITAKRWIGETEGLGDLTTSFALHLLSRLEKQADGEEKAEAEDDDADAMEMDDDDGPQMARVENAQVVGDLPVPKSEKQVTQHIELFLSLCAKTPDLLDKCVGLILLLNQVVNSRSQPVCRVRKYAARCTRTRSFAREHAHQIYGGQTRQDSAPGRQCASRFRVLGRKSSRDITDKID